MSKVAVFKSEEKTRVAYTTTNAGIIVLDGSMKEVQRIAAPHNKCQVDILFFLSCGTLASASRLDQRANFWTLN